MFDKTAKIIPTDLDFNIDEIMIPKSIRYHDIEFFVTKIDEKAIACWFYNFSENSKLKFIGERVF